MTFKEVLEELKDEYKLNTDKEANYYALDSIDVDFERIIVGIYKNENDKIFVSDITHTYEYIKYEYNEELIKEICKQFNVSYNKHEIFTEYQNIDSVKNVVNCIQKIADIDDNYFEQYDKGVEEISKTFKVSSKQLESCSIRTGLTRLYSFIEFEKYFNKIIITTNNIDNDHDDATINNVCKKYNIFYENGKIFTIYKDINDIQNMLNCVKELYDLHNKDIENLDKIVEEQISKLYPVTKSDPGSYFIQANTSQNQPIRLSILIYKGKIRLGRRGLNYSIKHTMDPIKEYCKKFNINFNGIALSKVYKNIDSIPEFIKFIEHLAEKFE